MIANEAGPAAASRRDADAWFTPGRFAAVLAGLIFLSFPGIILGQETFFYRDFGLFGYPLAHYQRECFWRGEWPLWNPLNNCGLPFLAQWNTLTLYPPSLFYLVFPLSWSLGVFNLGHLFLAGMGMYFLARRWTGNRLAGAVAGVAFAFNGLTWHALMWPNDVSGLGWMPWVALAAERAWREGGRQVALAALAGAMQMLTGAPEIILLTWLFAGMLWLGQFVAGSIPRGRMSGRVAAAGLLVAGVAAAQLLPFLDLLAHSHRDTGFGGSLGWAMPVSGPANFLVPLFHCFSSGHGVFVQYDQYWVSSHYLGAGLMALAVAGSWGARNRRVWLLLAVAVLSVIMALGSRGYLYSGVKAVLPQLGFIRYPIKFVVLAVLVIPILAAYGVSWHQAAAANSTRERKVIRSVTLLLLGSIGLIVWVAWEHPLVKDDWGATWHGALERAGFLVLAPGTLLLLKRAAEFKLQILLRLGLLLLLWLDVYTHTPTLSPTVKRSVYEPGLIRQELKLEPRANEPRFMETLAAMDKVRATSLSSPEADYLCHRLALFDDCNLLDDVPKIDGFYSLYLRDTQQIIAMLSTEDRPNADLKGLKDFLGVAYINPAGASAEKALDWVARDTYLPLVTAGQAPVFAAGADELAALARTDFDPRQTVYLPPEARASITAKRAEAKILSQQIEAQRLKVEVAADAPAMVVVAQALYHPWHAYVDGARVKLWRANHGFQALEVPPGRHEVKLVYEDRVFEAGAVISLATLSALAVVLFPRRAGVAKAKG